MGLGKLKLWIRKHWFELLLVATSLLAHLYVALSPSRSLLNWYNNDDAYYYFKVAQNIGAGMGSTFDGISLTNGYHPLWMLISIPVFLLSRSDLVLPLRVIVMTSALASSLTAVILFRLISHRLSKTTGMVIAVFWVAYNSIHAVVTTGGMESGISALFITWLIYRVSCMDHRNSGGWLRGHAMVTGLIATLAILSRLDNIYLAAIAGIWLLLDGEKGRSLLVLDIAFIPVILTGSYFLRLGGAEGFFFYAQSAYWFIGALLLLKVIFYFITGLYSPDRWAWRVTMQKLLLALAGPAVISFGILALLSADGIISSFPRIVVLVDAGLSLGWLFLTRLPAWLKSVPTMANVCVTWPKLKTNIGKLQLAISYALPNAFFLVLYMGFNRWMFGTFLPVSGQIKHWWSTLVNPIYGRVPSTFGGVLGFTVEGDTSWPLFFSAVRLVSNPLAEWLGVATKNSRLMVDLLGIAILVLVVYLVLRQNFNYWIEKINELGVVPLFAACLVQALYYGISGYLHTRVWYWIPSLVLGVLVLAVIVDALYINIASTTGERSGRLLQTAVVVAVVASLGTQLGRLYPYDVSNRSENPFILQARELEGLTEPGALIGTTGGGGLAYFIQERTIVNLDGLMNSVEYFEMMQTGTADEYLNRIGLDYVYEKKYVAEESDPYRAFLPQHLKRIARVGGIPLFQYLPGLE
ncbi:MAG: hypothetical protein C0391_02300 [Anaerolinea sp.]|nr:hypothetical protein [Anaerolinea sp.]